MRTSLIACCVFAIGFSTAAIADDSLAKVSLDWAHAWQAKKLDATLALYAGDAVFMDANGSRVTGKPALRSFFATVLAQYSAQPTMHSVSNGSSGDLGYDWGDYTETVVPVADPSHAIQTKGTYLVILKRISGHWLIASQMWTGNVPVPVKR
jgi:ketosteroid isomerase-like protein